MNSELTFKQGLIDTLPTVFGYIGIGIAFGMIGHSAGFSVGLIFLLSAIFALRKFNASKAIIPPSPLLSARMTMATYLMLMISIKHQKIMDKIPNTFSG